MTSKGAGGSEGGCSEGGGGCWLMSSKCSSNELSSCNSESWCFIVLSLNLILLLGGASYSTDMTFIYWTTGMSTFFSRGSTLVIGAMGFSWTITSCDASCFYASIAFSFFASAKSWPKLGFFTSSFESLAGGINVAGLPVASYYCSPTLINDNDLGDDDDTLYNFIFYSSPIEGTILAGAVANVTSYTCA